MANQFQDDFDTTLRNERQLGDASSIPQLPLPTEPDLGTFVRKDVVTAKGDLIAGTAANAVARFAAGANGQLVSYDNTTSTGLKAINAPSATTITENSGPTVLTVGAIPDGSVFKRAGSTVVGVSAELILATTTLNLNTNTKQTLYTVPAGKSAVITKVVLRGASVNLGAGGTTILAFGFNAGALDWNSSLSITDLTAATLYKIFYQNAGFSTSVIGTAAQTFGAITDAAYGSAATVVIDVFGYTF